MVRRIRPRRRRRARRSELEHLDTCSTGTLTSLLRYIARKIAELEARDAARRQVE